MHIEVFHQNVGGQATTIRQEKLRTSYENFTIFYQHLSGTVLYSSMIIYNMQLRK